MWRTSVAENSHRKPSQERFAWGFLFRFGLIGGLFGCVGDASLILFDGLHAEHPDWSKIGAKLFLRAVLVLIILKWWLYVSKYNERRASFYKRRQDARDFSILVALLCFASIPWPYGVIAGVVASAANYRWGLRDAAELRSSLKQEPL